VFSSDPFIALLFYDMTLDRSHQLLNLICQLHLLAAKNPFENKAINATTTVDFKFSFVLI
jgi:hypothetical protein